MRALVFMALLSAGVQAQQAPPVLKLTEPAGARVVWENPVPDVAIGYLEGTPGHVQMELGEFARGLSFYRLKRFWVSPVFTSEYRSLGDSQLLLWQRFGDGRFHMMAPLVGDSHVCVLGVQEHRFGVRPLAYAPAVARRIPLLVYAVGGDPYAVMRRGYEAGLPATGQAGKLRWQKSYPEALRNLGWCSWNAFYEKVSAGDVLSAARWLREANVPAKFILVDDGWMTTEGRKLAGLDALPSKFPGGLKALRDQLSGLGFSHMGVWHTLQGYWDGVTAALPGPHFAGNEGMLLPDPRGTRFYHDWYSALKASGVDFVKVDNQGGNFRFTDGLMPRLASNAGSQAQLQEAAAANFGDGVINCMEQTLENVYNWRISNVARSSDDYLPENRVNSAEHVLQNAYNSAWLSNFAYPDYDMFESGAPDGEFQAVARALSGGPVYCTDRPGKGRAEVLKRLCLSSGRLLQPDEPGRVPAGSLFHDPSLEPIPLLLSAGVTRPGGYQASFLGCFHVNKALPQVSGKLSSPPRGRWISRRWSGQKGNDVRLKTLEWDLVTWANVQRGIAVFGLLDKYLGAAAVTGLEFSGRSAIVRLSEGGRFGAWTERKPRAVSVPFTYRDHWVEAQVPTGLRQVELVL